jgi:FKBP-type peptidyl-prolyl cis-trans isomerase
MQTSGSGLRYKISGEESDLERISPGDWVDVKYNVGLINGTPCYSGIKQFKVDNDHVEKGIHEGVKLMKKGQKAIFILPSHLAHGLMGDGNKIPPKAILICELEVKSVKKS